MDGMDINRARETERWSDREREGMRCGISSVRTDGQTDSGRRVAIASAAPCPRGSKGSPTDDLVGPVVLKVTPDPQVPLAATPATANVMRPLVPLSLAIAVLLVGVAQAQFFRGLSNLFSGASNFFGGGNKFVDDGTQVGTRVRDPAITLLYPFCPRNALG